jgi:hypothetical protein
MVMDMKMLWRGLEDEVKMLMDVKMCVSYIVERGR